MKIPFFLLIFFHTVSFAQFTPVSIEDKKAQIQINKSLQNLTNDIRRKDLTTGGTVNGTVTVKNANIVISTTTGSYGIKFQDGTLQTTAGVGESTINVNTAQFFGDGSIASPLNLVTTSVTLQGNTFNGASQLVRTNSSSQVPLDITGNAATATSVPASGVDLSTVTTRFVAIEESTGTFVLRTGDTMTGQLTISGSSLTVTGAGGIGATYGITAATFTGTHYGDGANLTGIPASAITAGTFGAGDYIFTDSTMWLDLKHTGSGGSRLRFYNNAVYDSWLYDNSVGNVFEIGTNLATLNMVMGGNPLLSFSTTAGTLTGSASLNVLKAGDTMTGPLTVQTSSITVHSLTANANFNGFRLQDDSALPIDFQINGLNSSGQVTTLFVGGSSNRFGFRPMAHASDIVFMNSSGVGIGKNTPEYALDIGVGTDIGDGAIRTLGQAIFTGSATVQGGGGLGVTYGITAGSLTVNNNATITGSLFSPNVTATTGNSLTLSSIFNISAQSGAGYPIRLNTDSSADINLVGGGGRVGIDKVPPAYMLDVTGGGHFTSSMTVDGGYYGSGSSLTGVITSTAAIVLSTGTLDTTKVNRAGDTMTGQLTLSGSTLTVTGNAFSVGGEMAGWFSVKNSSIAVGTTTPAGRLHIVGDGGATSMLLDGYRTASAGRAIFQMRTGRGAPIAPSDLQTNDYCGEILFLGYAGGAFRNSGGIQCKVGAGTISATSMPSSLTFTTVADGSTTRTDRMIITPAGNVGVGTTSPAFLLDVNGVVQSTRMAVGSSMGVETLSCSAGQDIGGATITGGIITAASCSSTGSGDTILSATQTFTGAQTFTSSTTLPNRDKIFFGNELSNSSSTLLGAYNTSATSFSQCITGSTLTITTNGGRVAVNFVAAVAYGGIKHHYAGYLVDGAFVDGQSSSKGKTVATSAIAGAEVNMSFSALTGVLSTGSHSFCPMLMAESGGTTTLSTANNAPQFWVHEVR